MEHEQTKINIKKINEDDGNIIEQKNKEIIKLRLKNKTFLK